MLKQLGKLKKPGVLLVSCISSLLAMNVLLSLVYKEEHFSQLVFSDSFKAEKHARLFFADTEKIYKLADTRENGNVYPLHTDNKVWNVDGLGFRPDHKPNDRLHADIFVILMIGDSFTYGGEVAHLDSYPAVLEKKLLDNWYNVNVINAGVPGYGPDQQLVYLRELLPKINPDLVIWNLYENDITDANYYCLFHEEHGELTSIPSWRNNVYRQGYLVNALPWAVARQPATKVIAHFVGYPFGGSEDLPIATVGCTTPVTPERLEQLGQKVNIILHRAKEAATTAGAQIEFVLMPTQQSFLGAEGDVDELTKVEMIKNLPIFDDTPLLNLTDSFQHYSQEKDKDIFHEFYLSEEEEPGAFSRHLNATGNELSANIVMQYVVEKGLIEGPNN